MAVAALEQEILSLRKRRQLYSLIGLLLVVAVLVSGFSKSNEMNSGGFLQGLSKFSNERYPKCHDRAHNNVDSTQPIEANEIWTLR